jgi:hypothetical protein
MTTPARGAIGGDDEHGDGCALRQPTGEHIDHDARRGE